MRSPLRNLLSKSKQRGAVAIIFGLALTTVFGFMGLSLDLAQTYDRKTELQNAADAAALAGAKKLVGTTTGIDDAVTAAQNIAALHKFKFQTAVGLNAATIKFSSSPDTADVSWLSAADAKATGVVSTIFFIKIDTRGFDANYGQVNTNFMQLSSSSTSSTTNTFGRAVAGRFSLGLTPIAVCAIETIKYGSIPHLTPSPALPPELKEYGYRRGLAYNIVDLNPLGSPQNKYLLNPIDIPTGKFDGTTCQKSNDAPATMRPYICSGTASLITTLPGYAFTNTGFDATLETQFNTRFLGGGACSVPTDANIRQYPTNKPLLTGDPSEWMSSSPALGANNQTVKLTSGSTKLPFTPPTANAPDWGVLWSYNPAVQYAASPPAGGYTPYTTSDWPKLYPTAAPTPLAYPTSTTLGVPPAPYNQSSGAYFLAGAGSRDRRLLNVAIADCANLQKNSKCTTIPILGIGRFFMPVQAALPLHLDLEFAGLVPDSSLTAEIKLYH